eukprot:scaffold666_cov48-Cyclotella_meneghiniana.AAC.6
MSKKSSSTRSEGSISQPMPAKKPSTRNRKEHQAMDKKSVRFSKESEQVQIRRPSRRSLLTRWYSVEDYQSFQHMTYRDATIQSTVYLAAREADALLPKDEVAKCVGILHLLSEDVRRRYHDYKLGRLKHSHTVLQEQERQRELGGVSTRLLANVSKASSQEDRDRARMFAFLAAAP